ncbi:MAG: sulfatase-like hydrolase/transferase [Proteobacteria bacterium]|nr:sulfatase-like hydrolase/transferase [Pseudomonadota bacterium]MDA0960448.1 sulfatase-like hydrolase/transferase [Pseudomonadota bacterium]MDA1152006.1 sulfatase-like hydrolase/transferase [Pseudomonadota bacterium]
MNFKIPNQLILMTDEHTRKVLGCYGNKIIKTPNIDNLARQGTRFESAYTNVPICVPSRASFATGDYAHRSHHWDNATPYFGSPPSWGSKLQKAGITVGSIGKLHYRNSDDDVGLDFQKIPMHVVDGTGDVLGCVREPLPKRWKALSMAEKIGPGETDYNVYDRQVAAETIEWLAENGKQRKPWVLFVSMVAPHFPLIAPQEFYDLYDNLGLMPTKPREFPEHPWHHAMRNCQIMDNFTPERTRVALASYYGLVTFIDDLIGQILEAVEQNGLSGNTQIIYTSDHGDNIGERDFWGKSNFYEESVGVPCIIKGPGIPIGKISRTPVSLIDFYPTVLKTAGIKPGAKPGASLVDLANVDDDFDRLVFSEYHAMGSKTGAFMIRKGPWKLIYYVSMKPQLFNLSEDPEELRDLGVDPEFRDIRSKLERELRLICDPELIDAKAKADQTAIIEANGGIEAVVAKGGFGATPPPGVNAEFKIKR